MTLIESSTLVTTSKPSSLDKYKLTLNKNVSTNEIVLNAKAKEQYNKIYASYTNLNKHFKKIADEYRNSVSKKNIEGAKITKEIKKVAKRCEDQGKYCLNRQKNLKSLYKEAQVAKHYQDLEDTVKQQAELISRLTARVTALEGKK